MEDIIIIGVIAAATVNLKKKEAIVSLEKDISDYVVKAAIEKAGYEVVNIS